MRRGINEDFEDVLDDPKKYGLTYDEDGEEE
jgi:hypothetical protein